MNINLHIESMILDGLPVAGNQGVMVRTAVEAELARLLAKGDFSSLVSGAITQLSTSPIQLHHQINPTGLGHQIARAVHNSLAQPAGPRTLPPKGGSAA